MTNLFQRGLSSLRRINTLLASRPRITRPDNPVRVPDVNHHIRFSHTGFSYDDSGPVLSDICLDIRAGRRIGITGPPGSGKTTLVYLLLRLYDPDTGQIRIDDIPTTDLDPDALRGRISLMPQEPFLFSSTIKDNILMGRHLDSPKLDKVIRVCDLADTIAAMPNGLETRVGERGVTSVRGPETAAGSGPGAGGTTTGPDPG
jgi:ATP-binding cassette, subfamily B, multidrug efflux pump